ncbi:MAG TPA: exodeoxyribonuclease VII large subunit [Clostridiaceae bacterium]|jgi:exodeoxyribonuclease VII large subunit|nr:exodeoxyribonuclease VII large subunit [Clostridiaceae bacterium]
MDGVLSVTELNRAVNETLMRDPVLGKVQVRGEISGLKKYPSGHTYFTLKDSEAAVSCVLFRGTAQSVRISLSDGMSVVLFARPNLYDKTGRFQLIVSGAREEGIGDLFTRFLKLKEKLEREGLFETSRKKPIPTMPKRIVAVTSSVGAVIRDIIHVIRRRFPGLSLTLIPVAVQGSGAENEIAAAIATANRLHLGDVIIVGRGGGSQEDLQPFNEEVTARAIAASKIPVISAVGHETDYTIADFVADLRAPTPSAAAELVAPLKDALYERLEQLSSSLEQACANRLEVSSRHLAYLAARPVLINPTAIVERHESRLALHRQRLVSAFPKRMADTESRYERLDEKLHAAIERVRIDRYSQLETLAKALEALSPLSVLTRGYSVVKRASGAMVMSAVSLEKDDKIDIVFADGEVGALITHSIGDLSD